MTERVVFADEQKQAVHVIAPMLAQRVKGVVAAPNRIGVHRENWPIA